nr:MAG TPA: hypothetical protein [Caudoviricetes sp.]
MQTDRGIYHKRVATAADIIWNTIPMTKMSC